MFSVWNLFVYYVLWCILVFVSSFVVCCSFVMSCVFYFLCLYVFFLNCVDRFKLLNYIGEILVLLVFICDEVILKRII